jgi:riboflavin biosynthesis pyrimidine reductase
VRQLLPEPLDPVDPADVYADLPSAEGRPAVRLTMVASVDGAATVGGVSGPLGGPGDHAAYLAMRARADVVLVAAGTVRAEGYGPPALPPTEVAARRARGQEPLPRIAVVSRSLALDWDAPLFTAATSRPLVVTGAGAAAEGLEQARAVADVVLAGDGGVDLGRALVALGATGAHAVLAEGGPSLNGQLAAAGVLDELCLTVDPLLVAGDAGRIAVGAGPMPPMRLRLCSLCEEDGALFLRLRPV